MAEIKNLSDHGKWKDTPTMVQALEKLETASSSTPYVRGGSAPVNEREFESLEVTPGAYEFSYIEAHKGQTNNVGGLSISSIDPLGFDADSVYRSKAAATIRRIAPTNADMSLARMAGELRQWKDLLGVPKLSSSFAGKVGLQWDFGIKPTISDLENLFKSVKKMDSHYRQFVRDSGTQVRRSREVVLVNDTYEAVTSPASSSNEVDKIFTSGPVKFRRTHRDAYTYRSENSWQVYCNRRIVLRSFATFQYAAATRKGFGASASAYLDKAKHALGGGLNASTAYQLTPYSWLLDWYYDFGSLIEFQEGIADYSTVMSRCGFVVEEQQVVSVSAVPKADTSSYPWHSAAGASYATGRLQRRRRGSPYSMEPGWPTNASQLRILAMLGLTFLPG
jgi:hypothetical protein